LTQGEQPLLTNKLNATQQRLKKMNIVVNKIVSIRNSHQNLISDHNTIKQYYYENGQIVKA
jgi:hypothetical protein